MTNSDFTAIAFLVDRSGSMNAIRSDAEGAIAAFIDAQQKVPGRCTIRLSDFDTEYRTVYPSTPIDEAPPYTLEPRGATALLDAIGRMTIEFGDELAAMAEHERPGKVIMVVQTDGLENSSHEWSLTKINALIRQQREQYSWDFVYLGANQDAISVGSSMGFARDSSITYAASASGAANVGAAAAAYVTRSRSGNRSGFSDAERESAT
jgi:hypothetical protein